MKLCLVLAHSCFTLKICQNKHGYAAGDGLIFKNLNLHYLWKETNGPKQFCSFKLQKYLKLIPLLSRKIIRRQHNAFSDLPAPTAGLYLFLLHPKRVKFADNVCLTTGT